MKSKLLVLLLVLSLLLANVGMAFAQSPKPPVPAGVTPAAAKRDFGLPHAPALRSVGNINSVLTQFSNGGFEQGSGAGWYEESSQGWPLIYDTPNMPASISPHTGNWAAWLGGDDNEAARLTYQEYFTITSPTFLRFWYWIDSYDACGYDYAYVKVNGNPIHTWNLCGEVNTGGWVAADLDLSSFNGQTVQISFEVITDASYISSLFVDDVLLYKIFADVPFGYSVESYIHSLYSAGITGGCSTSPMLYCPDSPVNRAQMAIFLLRGIHGSSYTPPDVAGDSGFLDVPADSPTAPWIKELAVEGITGGCGNGNYCPTAPVSRAAMAIFLLRAKHGPTYVPPEVGTDTGFADVPPEYPNAAWIKQLVAENITAGCGGGNYCPTNPVTRAQMAVFLVRTFSLP